MKYLIFTYFYLFKIKKYRFALTIYLMYYVSGGEVMQKLFKEKEGEKFYGARYDAAQ